MRLLSPHNDRRSPSDSDFVEWKRVSAIINQEMTVVMMFCARGKSKKRSYRLDALYIERE